MPISLYRICIYGLVLCLSLGIGISPAHAKNCTVAKIYKVPGIDKVHILRAQGKKEQASLQNRKLCAGDIVVVPQSIPRIKIRYYTPRYTTHLKGGNQHKVCGIKSGGLKCFLASIPVVGSFLRKGNPSDPISMPLAVSEGTFYLFSGKGVIPLFWVGGQSPYQLTVKDAAGKMIMEQSVVVPDTEERATFSLTVPHTASGSTYSLTIQSAENEPLRQTLTFVEPPQFTSEDLWMNLTSLLAVCDDDKNWRLEIWRQLSAMPDSEQKKNFRDHLEADDLDPYHFGLCE
ncbi:MAG: hypothetical protein B6247_27260 [Candidatus Parabeggiatoa sp. nov. 2]|nr:MAG: hypothetical protein B6247_27260 [Beggiatoa sp. 4572_84]